MTFREHVHTALTVYLTLALPTGAVWLFTGAWEPFAMWTSASLACIPLLLFMHVVGKVLGWVLRLED
ncbi:hypothetical protein KGD82_16400 [Nocardiopsis eucommiae]|uniref:Uncharacterized protein n=1 Tax=Nocardiopsis eucommiae TaxID=2831970 RepID=A0A975L6Z5_9ACTN|nr:hypothetical protein KGD82_16400 [Nocardiopsis eucommiae]